MVERCRSGGGALGKWSIVILGRSHRPSTDSVHLKTDDVGVFCSPLSEEYFLAITHFNLGQEDVKKLCEGVVNAIFADEEEKGRIRGIYASWDSWN